MKLVRMGLAVIAVAVVAGVAYVGQFADTAGAGMAVAAQKFLGTLSPELRAKTQMPFDSPERTTWFFVPRQDRQRQPTRVGLRLEQMNAAQKEAALALVRAGTSPGGYTAAVTIMSLEAILHEQEKGGTNVRNPEWYFFSIFGNPGQSGKWGWRVEGHHLSLNYLVEDGRVKSATPAFFGANPATVLGGPRKGVRAIPAVDDLAVELFRSLDDSQRPTALQPQHLPEIENNTAAKMGPPRGIAASKLNDRQRDTLLRLIRAYITKLPEEVARSEMERITKAGLENVYFAFAGDPEQGKERTYRLQGPTFVAEFLNRQRDGAGNPANHIHSAWRHLPRDFGL
jgi:hypothetical protein